ncbi:MAG: hypothetical protein WC462_04760 [archaeon]
MAFLYRRPIASRKKKVSSVLSPLQKRMAEINEAEQLAIFHARQSDLEMSRYWKERAKALRESMNP